MNKLDIEKREAIRAIMAQTPFTPDACGYMTMEDDLKRLKGDTLLHLKLMANGYAALRRERKERV